MKMRHAVLFLLLIIVGIGAFYYHDYMDKNFVFMKNGTVIPVDSAKESLGMIFYEIDGEVFIASKSDVDSYGKPNSKSILKFARYKLSLLINHTNSEFKDFANDTMVSFGQRSFWLIAILAATALCIVVLLALHLILNHRQPLPKPAVPPEIRKPPPIETSGAAEPITRSDIINYFLTLFRLQIGASPNAPMSTKMLTDNTGGPNTVYELRIKHRGDWMRRRMSIGPLGEEAGSKSKCFYVIYDVHLVVKIPAKPIANFEYYIESIKKEGRIVNKLAPRESIVPRVSTILSMMNKLPGTSHLSVDQLEKKYVDWLRGKTDFQKYLKIKNTFVFFMDFSKYYFLGHIVESLHDVKDAMAIEMIENAETIFDNQKFRGRYGKAKESIGFEIRQVFDSCQAAIRQFLTDSGVSSNTSMFRIQTWFLAHLAGKSIGVKEAGLSENLVKELNLLIELNLSKHMQAVTDYRNMVTEYVHKKRFGQNKPQMAGIITNLLDLLAWLRNRHIAMRDLKPDNLLVAGDPAKYPLFLMNPDEYELGIIDVETAVDFEKSKDNQIKQPLLGGTPFYATPSHFFSNAALSEAFHDLSKILHLQDWFATLVMVHKAVTGELLFEHTARLFADIRNKIKLGRTQGLLDSEIIVDVSRAFWRSALLEFQTKMNKKEHLLKSIFFVIPDTAKQMFKTVLVKDLSATTEKITRCISKQSVFENPQSQQRLLDSSPVKIDQLRIEFENKVKSMGSAGSEHAGTIVFLKYLRTLKLHTEQQKQLLKRLEQQSATISAHTLLAFMFNNLYKSMFREDWWVKPSVTENGNDANVDEATLEATVQN